MEYLHHFGSFVGFVGVGVIVFGVVGGIVRFVLSEVRSLQKQPVGALRRALRTHLAYYLLLGLEFLIAADIIDTILSPNREELINLAIVVVLRSVISVSLNWELAQHEKLRVES